MTGVHEELSRGHIEAGAPKVSVIIPTHNRADLLPRAVSSVLCQTYDDYEIIIVDDCSTDHTRETVASWNEERIRYIRHTENRRQSCALNTGIQKARGKYVAFLDDDDEWVPTKLERQAAVLESTGPRVGLVYGWLDQVDDTNGRIQPRYRKTMTGDLSGDLLALNIPGPTITLMVRTQIARDVQGFDESLNAYNDLDFLVKVSQRCEIAALPEVVAIQHVGHGHTRMNVDSESVLADKADYIREHIRRFSTQLSERPEARAFAYLHLGRIEMLSGNTLNALTSLGMAVRLDPIRVSRTVASRAASEFRTLVGHRRER